MKKTAVVLNWVMLGIFTIPLIGMGIRYPSAVVASGLLFLLPFASALLAFRPGAGKVLIGSSIVLNVLMATFGIVYVLFGLAMRAGGKALLAAVILLPSAVVTCVVLVQAWGATRVVEDANNRVQTTEGIRAPEAGSRGQATP